MSGIYGGWMPKEHVSQYDKDINRLLLWNKAYGEEGEECFVSNDLCLGCFLEKLSLSAEKTSPVIKKNGKYAVVDAVIYNREELIEKGQFDSSLADEELLFLYIEKFGMQELHNINGDFCGAVMDAPGKKITLFRDHMGIRPLFYYADDERVVFSTDIRGLLSMELVDDSVDEEWLCDRITNDGVMGTESTEFEYINSVKPATYIDFTWENGVIHIQKNEYWKLGHKKIKLSSEEEYIARLRELITDSLKRRLDAVSGLVGAEMSGGLDSSVIDVLIKRFERECVYFSWAASPEVLPMGEEDERLIIDSICKREGITCNYGGVKVAINRESTIAQKMLQIGMEPYFNESTSLAYVLPPYINTLQICETALYINGRGARVVFSGHGGDEGVSHRCNPYELFHHKEYIHYLKHMWSTTKGTKNRVYRTLLRCHKNLFVSRKTLINPYLGVYGVKDILKQDFYDKYDKQKKSSLKFAYDAIGYIMDGGSRNRLDVTALLGAYSGVRYMFPYLDYRVIDYAVSIPRHMYLKNQKKRYIFREAFKDLLPETLYASESKEDKSWRSYVREPIQNDTYVERKKSILEKLDRQYWERYLNWEALEEWATQAQAEVDEMRETAISRCVSYCLQLQNVRNRSKQVTERV